MALSGNSITLFAEGDLSQYLGSLIGKMEEEIKSEDHNKLLNVNESQYIEYLTQRYSVEVPVIYPDRMDVSQSERMIPAEYHSRAYYVEPGKSYPRQVITFHLPFSGNWQLLRLRPSTWSSMTDKAGVDAKTSTLNFDHIVWENGAEPIKAEMDRTVARTQSMLANLSANIERHNQTVPTQAAHTLRARKEQLLKQSNLLASLGVPIRPANRVPTTFSVPVSKTKPIIRKPDAPTKPFSPEPTLDENTYRRILELCRDMGREMERHPDLYRDRGEEALRDHFLLTLSPHFESVTAETFNRKGKTDILIRHDKANVFVAECKFWGRAKMFLATIDQALSYLTWRDSKAAVLCFNQNQQHGPVLEEIQKQTPNQAVQGYQRDEVEEETDFTALMLGHMKESMNGYEVRGVRWSAKILTSHRPNAQETQFGADFVGVVKMDLPDFGVAKGFLAQAKRVEPGDSFRRSEWDRLVDQSRAMLTVTPESFVFLYSRTGITVAPATAFASARERCNPHKMYAQSVTRFYEQHFECFVGDTNIQSADIATLERLQAQHGLELALQSTNSSEEQPRIKPPFDISKITF